jgi:hypothetical protein
LLAKKILKRTTVRIPGLPGWRTLYINETCDSVRVRKLDIQINTKISNFIADPVLINRLVVSEITGDKGGFEKDTMRYFDQFPRLEEVVLTDRGRLYLVQKRDLPNINCYNSSTNTPPFVLKVKEFFENRGRNIVVSCCLFDRN